MELLRREQYRRDKAGSDKSITCLDKDQSVKYDFPALRKKIKIQGNDQLGFILAIINFQGRWMVKKYNKYTNNQFSLRTNLTLL